MQSKITTSVYDGGITKTRIITTRTYGPAIGKLEPMTATMTMTGTREMRRRPVRSMLFLILLRVGSMRKIIYEDHIHNSMTSHSSIVFRHTFELSCLVAFFAAGFHFRRIIVHISNLSNACISFHMINLYSFNYYDDQPLSDKRVMDVCPLREVP